MIYRPDITRGLEWYVDANFSGGWKDGNHDSPESVLSHTGFVIMYSGCPITWGSKLQTEIALSTTESGYIALSSAMREVIPFLGLMKETAGLFRLLTRDPVFRWTVWEDNESCITVTKSPNFTPWTKHIAIKNHHFRRFVRDGTIIIKSIDTAEKIADIFTNPLGEKSHVSWGISLWVGDSIGIPIGSDVSATQQIIYYFPVYYHCSFRGSVRISRTRFKSSLKLTFCCWKPC